MSNHQHTIGQQYLEVVFTDRREGMGLQDQLATIYKEKVLPLLETILNDHDMQDYTIQIDEITIDAGVLSSKNWEQELVERSVQQFKAILQKKLLFPWPRRGIKDQPPPPAEEGVQWVPEAIFHYNRFLQFVSSGAMPVSNGANSLQETISVLLNNKTEWQTIVNREAWHQLLLINRQALERLIRQCGDIAEEIINWLNGTPVRKESFYEQLVPITDLYTRWGLIVSLVLIRRAQQQSSIDANHITAPLSLLQSIIENNKDTIGQQVITETVGQQIADSLTANKEPQPATVKEEKAEQQEGIVFHVYNAGLIILHPFLLPFFSETGLLDQKQQWISIAAQQRAVLLSQYLVTGEALLPEFHLPLNKLLCGYPLSATLDNQLELTETEKTEAMQLLSSVIEHWGALKNTGAEALRASFLQRAGKLSHTEKGWQLQAEQKTFDILMQSIPWTISRIKTPWMQEWLLTDWI